VTTIELDLDRPDDHIRELSTLMDSVAIEHLVMHASFEVEVDIAFPREADPPMELDGAVRHEASGVRGRALGHPRESLRFVIA